jgi:uncharacterized protein (TIGR00297 family)
MQLLAGFIIAALIALLAHRLRSLSSSGALAAVLVGTIVFGLGGWRWAALLLTFFISSSLLTRTFRRRKAGLSEKFAKGGERDAGQVFGNGGLASLLTLLYALFPDASWTWPAFAASLAAVNADTWATELGVLSRTQPRLITDLRRRVEQGTSGGISPTGTLAALAGAGLVGLLAAALDGQGASCQTGLVVTLAGLLGSLADSWLGATLQAMYHCPVCKKETERHPRHLCGAETAQVRGWAWLNNDRVNLAAAAGGAAIALVSTVLM